MKRPYAIIDIDLTFVDSVTSPTGWLAWLNSMSGKNRTAEELNWSYSLGKAFADDLKHLRVDPMDWWRYPGIYDLMQPMNGAVDAVVHLHNLGYDIVFVSHVKGQHAKSKHNLIKRTVPVPYRFVSTKEKDTVRSGTGNDIFIDDRHEYINQSDARFKFKFNTKWTQFVELNDIGVVVVDTWKEFEDFVSKHCIPEEKGA